MTQLTSIKEFFGADGHNPENLVGEYLLVEMDGRLQPRAQVTKIQPNTYYYCGSTVCLHRKTCFAIKTNTGVPTLSVDFFDEEDNISSSIQFTPCGGWAEKLFIGDIPEKDEDKEFTLEELKTENDRRASCIRCKQPLEKQTWFLGTFKFCSKCEKELGE